MKRIHTTNVFLVLIAIVMMVCSSCEKNHACRYAGTWDFENWTTINFYDSTGLHHQTKTVSYFIGKITCMDEEKHILRIIFGDKDTTEVQVNDNADFYGCFKVSHFCKYRGFHYRQEGGPAGFFSDYYHLENLYLISDLIHEDGYTILKTKKIKGTKISK